MDENASPGPDTETARPRALVVACGALARELVALRRAAGWPELDIACLPAHWHNRPEKIAPAVRAKVLEARGRYERIYVAYGDCGTGGDLDRALEGTGAERVPGPHCYSFLMGAPEFDATAEAEPGCFYLTDYLARHFDRIVVKGLGLDRHPELLGVYFGNYTRLIHISQTGDPALRAKAEAAAERLGLAFEHRHRGYGELGDFIRAAAEAGGAGTASAP